MTALFISLFFAMVIMYVALLGILYRRQRHLIYHPEKSILAPFDYGLENFSECTAKTPDNETIQLWYRPAATGFPTIIYFHGNAYHMGSRAGTYGALARRGFGVLGVSYRGYGKSTGIPSESGLYNDARTAIMFLTRQKHIPLNRIIIYGESLGTGVAVQMATEFEVAGLILQAPYTSVAARAAEIYYFVPVNLLIKDSYNSLSKISHVKAPLLLFHGENDLIIPIAHAKTLFEAANHPKDAMFFAGTGHNDFDSDIISEHVLDFTRKHQFI